MNVEDFRLYCIQKPVTTEEFPFDQTTLVFKVLGKMFALTPLDKDEATTNLKCDPDRAIDLREVHPDIIEGFHMSKIHWNTIFLERGLDDALIKSLVDHSYELVISKFTKKQKEEYEQLKLSEL
jgi:predicted DNA-binding protein (MmcQ/YjbR family)